MHTHWNGFLPKRAIVMARHRTTEVERTAPSKLSEAPLVSVTSHETLLPSTVPASAEALLQQIQSELVNCTRCRLCEKRNQIVFGEGSPQARLVFVGESPEEQEDLHGKPFVGQAGQLLARMIEAMGLHPYQVYIVNIVKCRPPGNRNPEIDEVASCSPFLLRQLDAIRPEVIVALGKYASQTLLQSSTPITELRGHFHPYRGTRLMPTFHPAYLLKNPAAKKEVWQDLQAVARELGLTIPSQKTERAT